MHLHQESHTVDGTGFDFMANSGREAEDRDTLGLIVALVVIVFVAGTQYLGLL